MKSNKNKNITPILLIIAVAAILRTIYLVQFSGSPLFSFPLGPDVQEYDQWAKKIMSGGFLWHEAHIHAPFYPLFLSGLFRMFFLDYFSIRFFQLFMGFAAALPLYLCLLRIKFADKEAVAGRKDFVPIVFLALWAVYPPLIYYQAELVSEALLIPLLCCLIYFLYRAEGLSKDGNPSDTALFFFALAGLFGGLAAVTHPLSLAFIGIECVYLACMWLKNKTAENKKRTILPLLLFLSLTLVPVVPVCIYNSFISGRAVFIQKNSGFNFFLGNNANATGSCYLRPGPEWDEVHRNGEIKAKEKGVSKDRYFIDETLSHMLSHPLDASLLFAKKALMVWNFREYTAGADVSAFRFFTPFQRLGKWSFGLLGALALAGIFVGIRCRDFRCSYRHFIFLTLAFWLVQTLFVTSGRYRIAMLPALFLFAAYFFVRHICRIRSIKGKLASLGALACAAAVIFLPFDSADIKRERAEADTILGEALIKQGKYSEAEELLKRSLNVLGGWSRTYILLGDILLRQKRYDDAKAMFERAVELAPYSPLGYMNIGALYSDMGDKCNAELYLKKALEKDPESPEALYNYGYFLFRCRKFKEAKKEYLLCLKRDPANRKALNGLGGIGIVAGNFSVAEEYFERALKLDPKNSQLMVNLALASCSRGKNLKAIIWLNRALEISPGLPSALKLKELIEKPRK